MNDKLTKLADELRYAAEYAPFVTKSVAELLCKAADALSASREEVGRLTRERDEQARYFAAETEQVRLRNAKIVELNQRLAAQPGSGR